MDATLRTKRLTLRLARLDDLEAIFPLFDNWNVIRWLSAPPWPSEIDKVRAHLEKSIALGAAYDEYRVIEHQGAIIGGISWRQRPASALQSSAGPNIGYWLGEPYWGRGFMSEAAEALVAELFRALPAPAIYSGLFEGNAASLRIQQKLGFVIEARCPAFSNPKQAELPHLNTVLSRAAFAVSTRSATGTAGRVPAGA